MMMPRYRMLCLLLAVAGCASSPEARFYTLSSSSATSTPSAAAAGPARYSVAVGPVSVPETVDRPQLVIRRGDHRIEIAELHRWAQPLRLELVDALTATLERRLPQARIARYNVQAVRDPDCRVQMDIERFDAVLDVAVTVQGWWTVRCNAQPPRTARFTEQARAQGGFDAVASAYAMTMSAVAEQIAGAVAALQAGK
ncbi:MAG TPA: PqiC family protein [Noviherbaspirillum sp.]